jgi:nitrile hydratase subunit beta
MAALAKEMVEPLVRTGASTRVDAAVAPRFRPGDRVVARNINPAAHTRLPRYVRGKRGTVERDHGVFVFPDTSAHGLGHKPQHVYSVRFMARELWGDGVSDRDALYIDLWDDYLETD